MRAHIQVRTRARESLEDITSQVREVVRKSGISRGLCHLFVPHTTAGVLINENADPAVCQDILERLSALVPRDQGYHHLEGNADAHIKSSLVGQGAWVPVEGADLALGRWQGIFLAEFDGPRERTVVVSIVPLAGGGP